MNEHPKNENENRNDESKQENEETDESLWASDQEKRSYYYDDAAGYEVYNPDEDDEDE